MPKVGMQPIRRRQLIEATIQSIHARGLADTTVKQIGQAASISPGIIHHYFGSKDELLVATMRSLLEELRTHAVAGLAAATSPRERAEAILDANFSLAGFEQPAVTAWLAFWAEVRHEPKLMRLQTINSRRLESNLVHALAQLLPRERARAVAVGLMALMDGLWLKCALTGGGLDQAEARAITHDHLNALLAVEKPL